MKDAATLGSALAQYYMGVAYAKGENVEQDWDRARRYFRLCAVDRNSVCQFNLGQSLLSKPQVCDRDGVQGMAWLELAAEQGSTQAQAVLTAECPKRTEDQLKRVAATKKQLIPAN